VNELVNKYVVIASLLINDYCGEADHQWAPSMARVRCLAVGSSNISGEKLGTNKCRDQDMVAVVNRRCKYSSFFCHVLESRRSYGHVATASQCRRESAAAEFSIQ
jgi:hypothetical protein